MIHYVEQYGHMGFDEKPWGDVDCLVLCQFCYLKFDGIVPELYDNKKSIILRNVGAKKNYEALFQDDFFEKKNKKLLEAMKKSKRFGRLRMNYYVNVTEKEWETQFSAVTFFLEDGSVFIAFRGTDVTIVGWKEDFNMTFMNPVPGQAYSVRYINEVAQHFSGDFSVGGHSKGGNLAVYGGTNCDKWISQRIRTIYSMDGPGIRKETLQEKGAQIPYEKIIKILPQSSLIGLMFEESDDYLVVESNSIGILQHDPYSWVVKTGEFKRMGKVFRRSIHLNETLSLWLTSIEMEKRKQFIDAMYSIISATEEDNVLDIAANWKHSLFRMKHALADMDEETEEMLKQLISSLLLVIRLQVKQKLPKVSDLKDIVRDAIEHQ